MHRNCWVSKFLFTTGALLLILSQETLAQSGNTHPVYWIRYQNQLTFNPSLNWTNEADNRRFFSPDVESQFIVHSRLHYKRGRWDYATGLSLSWAYAASPDKPVDRPVLEIRPVAEVSYEMPMAASRLIHRVRLDNRFFETEGEKNVFEESTYVARFRYRLQAIIPLKKTEDETKVTLKLADEIMLNHRRNSFDQNRISAACEFLLSKNISVEGGYIYIYQQRFGTDAFIKRHVLRFTVFHRIFLR
jgi:hypothetical protein